MTFLHCPTTEHKKGQHLSYEHRVLIQLRLKDGCSANRIAKETGCAPNTVRKEFKVRIMTLYIGKSADTKPLLGKRTNKRIASRVAVVMIF